ncbi:unnamed protein product [Protopolystoma xenopodis]|uniref:alanine transaminase n=1 Tax=Protopolystoma xenopodis TaxID=117903 RepID=A0A448WN21_9PLAT|nr:unnamed protein product [Protopolystoma xenopodis]
MVVNATFKIDYYLDEAHNWGLSTNELERAMSEADGHCQPRAIIVINPGNPTGQVLPTSVMYDVIRFAVKYNLVLLADEVYQFNIYRPDTTPWTSFKSVLSDMGAGYADTLQLVSFMSASKGYMGECVS